MRVVSTLGSLVLGAGLCAARVLSSVGSATTGLEETTSGLTVTETQTTVESAAALETSTTEASTLISSFTTKLATTTYVTSQETETSTTVDEATSTTIGATTTTAELPVQTANLVQNGGFEDSSIEPWWPQEPLQLSKHYFAPRGHIVSILSCDDNINTVELLIDGVFDSGDQGIIGDSNYHEFSNTFSYVGPSIDSTDLCIIFKVNQGVYYSHYLDGISLTRGKAVPIPAETD
uniref:Uncharacterized protein n=1 Tax=Fusarium oxysporum (strain Fo5176) TaxID=660025 RepID=A0A0D2XY07_FUSOF